jgi:hypothetical protein
MIKYNWESGEKSRRTQDYTLIMIIAEQIPTVHQLQDISCLMYNTRKCACACKRLN